MGNSGAKAKRIKIGHNKRLMELVSSDQNMEELRKSLAQPGVNVNMRDITRCENRTALMYAASKGSLQCVKVLLEAGADVNVGDKTGQTALSYAAYRSSQECVNALLAAGANVNSSDTNGKTPLMWAARRSSLRCVKVLTEAGADVNVGDKTGQTALSYAAYSGSHQCVNNLLVAGTDVNKKNKNGCTALFCAVYGRHRVITEILLEAGAGLIINPGIYEHLISALKIGHDKIVAVLIAAGFNVKDPLAYEAKHGVWYNKYMCSIKCVHLLLKAGAHVNQKFMFQNSLLLWYLYNNRHPDEMIVNLLYAAGEVVESPRRCVLMPELLQGVEAVRKREKCGNLKDLCRVSIRNHLLNLDLHSNLFVRVPKLGLPSLLTRYLLYDMTLDAPRGTLNNGHDN